MCYLQGSSTGVRVIKTSYRLDSLTMFPQMLSRALSEPPRKSRFWVRYSGHCLSRSRGGPESSFLNCIWIWVEVIAIIVICKQKVACQGFANCVLSTAISLSPGSKSQLCAGFRTISHLKLPTSKQMFGWPRSRFCGDVKRWRTDPL